jgi:hypothetical protein
MGGRRRPGTVGRVFIALLIVVLVLASGPILAVVTGKASLDTDWRSGSRESAGMAPAPTAHAAAVVQVYSARAVKWRGAFGVHSWISVKERDADAYRVYEVIGWRHYRGLPSVSISNRPPDGRWFGAEPVLLADLRGPEAARAIKAIDAAARGYPYANAYRVWPGPNSNTFTAHIARQIPELRVYFPATAVGKDYLPGGPIGRAPSGTGYQFSLYGLLGLMAARDEGVELNLLGLSVGVAPAKLTLNMPGLGHVRLWDAEDRL